MNKFMRIVSLFFLVLFLNFVSSGEASLSPSDVSVVVDTHAPEIIILSPLNATYNSAEPILANYSVFDPTLESIWYSINSGVNITPPLGIFYLELGEGLQHLIIYANDSFGRLNFSEIYFTTEYVFPSFCSDGTCNSDEDCDNCPEDCGECPPPDEEEPNQSQLEQPPEIPLKADFSIDKSELKVSLSPGEKINQTLTIRNTGEKVIKIIIFVPPILRNFVTASEESFFIKSGIEKVIILEFNIPETAKFDVHTGEILISGLGIEKNIPVTIEIESKDSLFDVILRIAPESFPVYAGKNITAEVEITDIGEAGLVNVTIDSVIKDFKENVLVKKQAIVSVNQKLIFNETLEIPSNATSGKYVLYAIVTYDGKSATSSQNFDIIEKFSWEILILFGLILLAILGIILGYFLIKSKKIKIGKILKIIQKKARKKGFCL